MRTLNESELLTAIFEDQWCIQTKFKWLLTEKFMEEVGVVTSGDYAYDMEMANQWTRTTRPISELATMLDEGKEFMLEDEKDHEKIFNVIMQYTNFVASRLNHSLDLDYLDPEQNEEVREVLNDVVKLQNLAAKLYPIMIDLTPDQEETKGLIGFINRRGRRYGLKHLHFNPVNRFGFSAEVQKEVEENVREGKIPRPINIENALDMDTLAKIRRII